MSNSAPSEPTADEIAAGSFVSVKVAAARIGVSLRTVYYLLDNGDLPYLRPTGREGKLRRVSAVFLDYYIRRNLIVR